MRVWVCACVCVCAAYHRYQWPAYKLVSAMACADNVKTTSESVLTLFLYQARAHTEYLHGLGYD